MCDGLTFKMTSIDTGEPRTTRSVGDISRDLKELEAPDNTFFIESVLVEEAELLSSWFSLTVWKILLWKKAQRLVLLGLWMVWVAWRWDSALPSRTER